MHNGTSMLIIH